MSYCTVCDVTENKPSGRCPACGRNWGPSILDGIFQGPFDDPDRESLRVFGVTRMADNEQAVLIVFQRRPTDDELRSLHESLAGRTHRERHAKNR